MIVSLTVVIPAHQNSCAKVCRSNAELEVRRIVEGATTRDINAFIPDSVLMVEKPLMSTSGPEMEVRLRVEYVLYVL